MTERWQLFYIKLYDKDDDEFDLSRVPDVHDNVRFDMLHNPHLGLTLTLEKLYTITKLMVDCVVQPSKRQKNLFDVTLTLAKELLI